MKALILIAALAVSSIGLSMGCAQTKPDAPACKHPENVYTASTPEKKASYVDAEGKTRYCTVGHCKSASGSYNACSASATLCCDKE